MKKSILTTSLILSAMLSFSGCSTLENTKNIAMSTVNSGVNAFNNWAAKCAKDNWNAFQDKSIRDSFLTYNDNDLIQVNETLKSQGFSVEKYKPYGIFIGKLVAHTSNFSEMRNKIYGNYYISEQDALAKKFIDQAFLKGHEVRLYKSALSGMINNSLDQAITTGDQSMNNYDADPVLIEYDQQGSPIAFMTRSWQSFANIGVTSHIYTNIYFGNGSIRWLENNIGNSQLNNLYIKTYKPNK